MIDHKDMKARLAQAAQTLHHLPQTSRSKPMGHKSTWPDMVRKSKKGAILHRGNMNIVPNSKDITDCYRVIDGLYQLTEMQRQLLWARANHIAWHALHLRFGRSRTHLNRLYHRGLIALCQIISVNNDKSS